MCIDLVPAIARCSEMEKKEKSVLLKNITLRLRASEMSRLINVHMLSLSLRTLCRSQLPQYFALANDVTDLGWYIVATPERVQLCCN